MQVDADGEEIEVEPAVIIEKHARWTNNGRVVPEEPTFFPEGPGTFWISIFQDGYEYHCMNVNVHHRNSF
jgi:hypothetical protein